MIENTDYELVPLKEQEDAWGIRIMTGQFVETVIAFGNVSFNKVKDHLQYNFAIIESPDSELTSESEELQEVASKILESIISEGVKDGTVTFRDRDTEVQ